MFNTIPSRKSTSRKRRSIHIVSRQAGHSNAHSGPSFNRDPNLTAARQIRGNIPANLCQPRQPYPSRIRREEAGSCRMKNACRSFAFGSSQRNHMTLMFGADALLVTRLKRLMQLRISHHAARYSRRAVSADAA
jgi:hypothetical protein